MDVACSTASARGVYHPPMLTDLAVGRLGLTLDLPPGVEVEADRPHSAEVVAGDPALKWWLFHWPGRRMDLSAEHFEHLRAHAEHHARDMFELTFAQQDNPEGAQPRTARGWSPLVDFERIDLDGTTALRSVHRMLQRPGREIMLGHLLVPLASGLFEARVVTADTMTGVRETALMMLFSQQDGKPLDELAGSIDPRRFDDPQHDEKFPEHCLSQARASLRWMEGKTAVRDGWRPTPQREAELPESACALVPAPRFVRVNQEGPRATFERVSFCGTDGVDQLVVEYEPKLRIPQTDVEGWAEHRARHIHLEADVDNVQVATSSQTVSDGRTDVLAIVEGDGHQGRLRNAMWWIRGDKGAGHCLSLVGSAAVPASVLAEELAAVAATWRPMDPPKKRRFKLW